MVDGRMTAVAIFIAIAYVPWRAKPRGEVITTGIIFVIIVALISLRMLRVASVLLVCAADQ